MAILIVKADGTQEPFNPEKLISSLMRTGAEQSVARGIANDIERELYPGITTQEIYRHAFARLRDNRRGAAARYSLKRALLDFGPSGFPFEAYLAELFRAEGGQAQIDQIVEGACVDHEVDVVVRQDGVVTFIEAKFHNAAGFKTDLKTVLYVKARLDDLAAARKNKGLHEPMRGLVVTNTKFSGMAVQYAACAGVELLSWDQPAQKTLEQRIDAAGLYPITALTTLGRREKTALLGQKVVLCTALRSQSGVLAGIGVSGDKAERVLQEIGDLCVPKASV